MPNSTPWVDLPIIPTHTPTLNGSDVHLWRIPLAQSPETVQTCAAILSPDETARAQGFHFQYLRDRFTVAHAALRQVLATYLGTLPSDLIFHQSSQGKPSLAPIANPTQLTFNLSHSNDLALLAVTTAKRIGIDLEHCSPQRDLAEIATRNFSPAEASALSSLSEDQRTTAFYACWTLKEAYLKATGDGLSMPLDSFEVHFPPFARASLASIGGAPDEHHRWQAYSLVVESYAAAVVVEGQQHYIYRAQWISQTG